MASYFRVIFLLVAIFALSYCHPTVKEEKEVKDVKKNDKSEKTAISCPPGEILDTNGKCVKAAVPTPKPTVPAPKPTLSAEQLAKRKELKRERKQKKRTIKKKLDDEIKEIKRLVFEGLEKGTIDLKCPDGKEINDVGVCAETNPATPDAPLDDKKSKRAKAIEKRLERELERVLKKEIQNEIRRKRRREQNKQKKSKKTITTVNNAETPKSVVEPLEEEILPICAEDAPVDAKDCRPRT